MKRIHDPQLLDHLAGAYALGTLRGGARRRLEALAREHPTVRAALLVWQGRITAMTELQEPVPPSPAVWVRIENLVRADIENHRRARQTAAAQAGARAPSPWWMSLSLWRGTAVAGMLAALMAGLSFVDTRQALQTREAELAALRQAQPTTRYVAVLNDQQAGAAMLVTFDPSRGRLTLQRVGSYQEAADRSLQLWALPPGRPPRSLGVLGREPLLHLAAHEADVADAPALAISLEPAGGVPGERGPTGPVLFTGTLIRQPL